MTDIITITPKAEKTAKELLKDFFAAKAAIEQSNLDVAEARSKIIAMFGKLASQCDIDEGENGYTFDIGNDAKFAKVQKKKTSGTDAKPAYKVLDVTKLKEEKPEVYKKLLEKYFIEIPAVQATDPADVYDIRLVNKSSKASKTATKVGAKKKAAVAA